MSIFQWQTIFQIGDETIDSQHQNLVAIMNRFGDLVTQQDVGIGEIEKVCTEIVDYTRYHFAAEHNLMITAGLDPHHVRQHMQEHEDLVSALTAFKRARQANEHKVDWRVLDFLGNWLVFHILGTDMLMARQIDAMKRGRTAAQAYEQEEAGNSDYAGMLLTSMRNLLNELSCKNRQLFEINESLEQKVQLRTLELSQANEKLKRQASIDELTGVLNRRAFNERALNLLALATRHRRPLSLLMIDVDHFKKVNDSYGHHAGDLVLKQISRTMRETLRDTDILGRIGGEEFAILLPETDREQTGELVSRLLINVREMSVRVGSETSLRITISIGVADVPPVETALEAAMRAADVALYQAKAAGRDRSSGPF